jgi:probable H4MPT-linked C1 transfer pathway protein
MTGELADCFETRAMGVATILEQVTRIVPSQFLHVYCVDGKWRSPAQAARDPWMAAASNWHALARWASRMLSTHPKKPHHGLIVDVGSTTIDIIPINTQGVATRSTTDSQRLRRRELIYTGVERSNLAGLLRSVPLFGKRCPVMNEQFATTRDAYVWLKHLPEEHHCCQTADGRPATRLASRFRLARVVGEDGSTLTDSDIDAIALTVLKTQCRLLERAMHTVIRRVAKTQPRGMQASKPKASSKREPNGIASAPQMATPPGGKVILSGHGGFLVESALKGTLRDSLGGDQPVRLADELGPELSRCAPAYAVAMLAAETKFPA